MIITQVTVFVSERIIQTIVFNEKGHQLAYLQGSNFQYYKEILKLSNENTHFYLGVWKKSRNEIDSLTYETLAKAFFAVYEQKEIIKYFRVIGNEENEKEII